MKSYSIVTSMMRILDEKQDKRTPRKKKKYFKKLGNELRKSLEQ